MREVLQYSEYIDPKVSWGTTSTASRVKAAPEQAGGSGVKRQNGAGIFSYFPVLQCQREREGLPGSKEGEGSNRGVEDLQGGGNKTARCLDEMGQCAGEKEDLGWAVES